MTTRITTPVRREIEIDGEPFTVVLSQDGIRLSRKRFRDGRTLTWRALRDGMLPAANAATLAPYGTRAAPRRIE